MTKISTQLDKETVLARLRELVEEDHLVRVIRSGYEGDVSGHNVTVAYRTGWFVPPIQVAVFRGRVLDADAGTTVLGDMYFSWWVYLIALSLVLGPLFTIVDGIDRGSFSLILPSFAGATIALLVGRVYVGVARRSIVDEICKTIGGSVVRED